MGCCFGRERSAPGPAGTEKLLNPGDPDYDKKMSELWGGPPPEHYPRCWQEWPALYKGNGKVALVTGGTGGIGFYVAKMLAHLGYEVVLPVRTGFDEEGKGAVSAIRAAVPQAKITVPTKPLDLESLQSVRDFAKNIRQTLTKIDLLCLNAGRGGAPGDTREVTADNIEAIVQVNAVSHLLLAMELLPLLQKSDAGRIVSQSSGARFCNAAMGLRETKVAKLANLGASPEAQPDLEYNAFHQYQLSKACNVFFTLGMNQRLKARGINHVKALTCEPGLVCTGVNIQHNLGHGFIGCFDGCISTKFLHKILGQHAADGALPMLLASVDPEPDISMFYGPAGGVKGMAVRFDPSVGDPPKNAILDPANIEGSEWPRDSTEVFWKQAEQWTGLVA